MTLEEKTPLGKEESWSIEELIDFKEKGSLTINDEYQRGEVWNEKQKIMFIDSIWRNYPIPLIYLHDKSFKARGDKQHKYEIIDGQQRINALYNYVKENLKLDTLEKELRPNQQKCSWKNKTFEELTKIEPKKRKEFLNKPIRIVLLNFEDEDIRDIFIRLQEGLPLTSQDKRDAWPGKFTDFILQIGGKPALVKHYKETASQEKSKKYIGHTFFKKAMNLGSKIKESDERKDKKGSNRRKHVAQLYIRYESYPKSVSTEEGDIDTYYRKHTINFDMEDKPVKRFLKILDILQKLYDKGEWGNFRPTGLKNHAATDLIFLAHDLMDDYVDPGWQQALHTAYKKFRENLDGAKEKKKNNSSAPNDYWDNYLSYVQHGVHKKENIDRRHKFFQEKMLEFMEKDKKFSKKDPKRLFNSVEANKIYILFDGICLMCKEKKSIHDCEIHHVKPHGKGGKTKMDNAALLCKECHRQCQGAEKIKEVKEKFSEWKKKKEGTQDEGKKEPQMKGPTDQKAEDINEEYDDEDEDEDEDENGEE